MRRALLPTVFVVLAAVPLVTGDPVWLDLGVQTAYYVLLAISWNLLGGYVGIFSFGHVAFAMIGAYASAMLGNHIGWPVWLDMLVGGLVAGLLGGCLGLLSLRVRGAALVVCTFAFAQVTLITAQGEYPITGGSRGMPSPYLFSGGAIQPDYLLGLGLVACFLLIELTVMRSHWRYYLVAIRDDEAGAAAIGLDTIRWKTAAFAYASLWAGLAGAFSGQYLGFITPHIGSFTEMALVLIMAVAGGLGTLWGPVAGAVTFQLISQQLRGSAQEFSALLFGVAVLIVVVAFPEGIAGLPHKILALRSWMRRASVSKTPATT